MSDTILYYRTFPLTNHGAFPSPSSVRNSIKAPTNNNNNSNNNNNDKRNTNRIEQRTTSLGRPAKLQKREEEEEPWICPSSIKANQTGKNNSIQRIIKPIIDDIKLGFQRSDKKDPISLATADASLSHIPPCTKAMEAIVQAVLRKPHTASYTHACGAPESRRAIAAHHSFPGHHPLSPEHVIVTNGCSGALEVSLASLLDPGTSLLVPQPGFPLYEEIAESHGASVVRYRLDPNRRWECDMDHLEEIMNDASNSNNNNNNNIRAMVINNPSSHGAVFSEEHLRKLLDFALRHRLPIVSDEVYGDLTFGANTFHPLAKLAAEHGRRVPIITTSGLSKQFLVPGWRIGWVAFHDNVWGSLKHVEAGAQRLAKLQHGVSHLQQSAIPRLLSPTSTPGLASWKEHFRATLERQATLLCSKLDACDGLTIRSPPQGSMYAIVGLDLDRFGVGIGTDVDFCHELVREENVFVLPGSSFGVPSTVRVAYSASVITLEAASRRIASFCQRHTT